MSSHGGPSGGGAPSLLARIQYGPSVYSGKLTTSTSLVVADATNLTISFKAPASGDVLVRLTGIPDGTGSYIYWGLLDHTSAAQVGLTSLAWVTVTVAFPSTAVFLVTGLTPGTTYQYDWAHATSSGNGYLLCQGATGPPSQANAGLATMEVWAA